MASVYKKVLQKKDLEEEEVQPPRPDNEESQSEHDSQIDVEEALPLPEAVKSELSVFKDADPLSKQWKNRQRTMVFSTRGISGHFKSLVSNIIDLLPNSKVEPKLERKNIRQVIDDLCYERSCNNYLFFDQHKHMDLYLWLCKSPSGPSIKF